MTDVSGLGLESCSWAPVVEEENQVSSRCRGLCSPGAEAPLPEAARSGGGST